MKPLSTNDTAECALLQSYTKHQSSPETVLCKLTCKAACVLCCVVTAPGSWPLAPLILVAFVDVRTEETQSQYCPVQIQLDGQGELVASALSSRVSRNLVRGTHRLPESSTRVCACLPPGVSWDTLVIQ